MKELIKEFRKYPKTHPLRTNIDELFTPEGDIKSENMPNHWMELNAYNMIGQALKTLQFYSPAGYKSMIGDKLKAKDKDEHNWHNFLSAMCELAVMYSFIISSDQPDSFVYEDNLRKDNKKDVDFSIAIGKVVFHVEIKSGNMLKQQMEEHNAAKKDNQVVIADQRIMPLELLEEIIPDAKLFGSLDNKIKDFLTDSLNKFNTDKTSEERNVLFICWDENIFQPCTALLSEHHSLLKEVQTDAIDYIVVSDLYRQMESMMYGYKNPVPGSSPFFIRFCNTKVVDNGFDKEDEAFKILDGIVNGLEVADEAYIKTCPEMRFTIS